MVKKQIHQLKLKHYPKKQSYLFCTWHRTESTLVADIAFALSAVVVVGRIAGTYIEIGLTEWTS